MNRFAFLLVALVAAGCGAPASRPRSVAELAADPPVLQGLIARCSADRHAAARDPECANARLAMDQRGAAWDREHVRERGAEFDRQRELRRQQEELARRASAPAPFDPYSAPVAPDSPPSGAAPR